MVVMEDMGAESLRGNPVHTCSEGLEASHEFWKCMIETEWRDKTDMWAKLEEALDVN